MNVLRSIVRVLKAFTSSLNFILNVTVFLALILSLPVMWFWPFGRTHNPTVEVYDKAHILSSDTVAEKIQEIGFRQDVHVVVVSVPGYMIGNLNAEVLRYARTHQDAPRPWISSSNSNYWSDGTVILAVAPDSRKVGCYFGQDVRLSSSNQASIQSAAKKQFNNRDWGDGVVAMTEKAADLMGRPAEGSWLTTLIVPAPVAMIGAWLLQKYLRRGLRARAVGKEVTESYSRVAFGYDETELNARTIPETEPYGAQVRMRYRWYCQEYVSITKDLQAFGSPRGPQWFSWRMLRRVSELKKRSAALESLSETISNTASLLNMSSTWEKAWENEQGPVLEDLQSLRRLCHEVDSAVVAENGSIAERSKEEREWVRSRKQRLDDMTSDLENGSLQPSAALDELDEIASETKTKASRLAREAIDADTSRYADERRRRYDSRSSKDAFYAGYWYLGGGHGSYNPHSTIRLNPSSPAISAISSSGSGVGAGGSFSSFTPVSDLVVGYSSASSYTPSSSSGSSFSGSSFSGGYSGGGGFSGSGSSSSF